MTAVASVATRSGRSRLFPLFIVALVLCVCVSRSAQQQVAIPPAPAPAPAAGRAGTPPTATTSAAAAAAPTTSSRTECDKPAGVCTPKGLDRQCMRLDKAQRCQGFIDYYLPLNLRDYFEDRFPDYKSENIPLLQNATMFDLLFGTYDYSYLSKYQPQYSVSHLGCTMPNQRWYATWICMDVLKFYRDKKEPCAMVQASDPAVCQSTLQERANSLLMDLNNRTVCTVTPAFRAKGYDHANSLPNHPWSKGGASICIGGTDNEASNPTCGFPENLACRFRNCTLPDFDILIRPQCDVILAKDAQAAASDNSQQDASDPNLKVRVPFPVSVVILGSAAGLVFLASMFALSRIRTRNGRAAKKLEKKGGGGGAAVPVATSDPDIADGVVAPVTNASNEQLAPHRPPPVGLGLGIGSSQSLAALNSGTPLPAALPVSPTTAQHIAFAAPPQPVHVPYNAEQPDEVTMRIGDIATVVQEFGDGWGYGTNLTTGAQGVFPLTCFSIDAVPTRPAGGYVKPSTVTQRSKSIKR